ncbi:MAG: NAD(P)H-binding protein [Sediminibacterium sp.]|jgi:uncharacterized protein YbjT (DUF2867 family)|nr:NAD(P)H-binding protein [Hydrotalea sp.]MCU0336252.1 NAD(P)H-binding protein [Sediminibacterium sp.]
MKAAVIGATGLIGFELTQQLSKDKSYHAVSALVRRAGHFNNLPIEEIAVDFSDEISVRQHLGIDVLFICMGTTIRKAGSKQAFEQADLDIPLRCARIAHQLGCSQVVLVSSVGANSESSNFYLHVKGKLEDALSRIPWSALHIFQPSLLMGPRKELRVGEKIASWMVPITNLFCVGPLQQYHSMPYNTLAAAMRQAAQQNNVGIQRYTYSKIIALAQQS